MSKKGKSLANPMAELNFVAAVQLEEAVQMVWAITDSQHEVILTKISEDVFKFRINYLPNATKEAEIWGTLQRWQGTDTKIDASGYVVRLAETEEKESQGCLRFFMEPLELLFVGEVPIEINKSTVSFRARDHLLQRIIDTFKADNEVETYVPEITQQEQNTGKS